MYPKASLVSIDLLEKLLQFNPAKRFTVEKCLEHDYFKDIRELDYETKHEGKIDFAFEKEEKTLEEIKKLLYDEMM